MDEKMKDMAEQLRRNPGALRQLMQSQEGQRLMAILTGSDGGSALRSAARAAAKGDTAQMQAMVQQLMQSREGAELAENISRRFRER